MIVRNDLKSINQQVSNFNSREQFQFYGWILNQIPKSDENEKFLGEIISELHDSLPQDINSTDLKSLVNTLKGHMHQLGWIEVWQFNDIINPLLNSSRAKYDDACNIWLKDLIDTLEKKGRNGSLLFSSNCEARSTNVCAYLFAYSSPKQQTQSLKLISKILNAQSRVIQQPLASTSNWSKWNDALKVSQWIYAFTKWCTYYLYEQDIGSHSELSTLAKKARDLTLFRPETEWHIEKELLLFIEEIDELLEAQHAN